MRTLTKSVGLHRAELSAPDAAPASNACVQDRAAASDECMVRRPTALNSSYKNILDAPYVAEPGRKQINHISHRDDDLAAAAPASDHQIERVCPARPRMAPSTARPAYPCTAAACYADHADAASATASWLNVAENATSRDVERSKGKARCVPKSNGNDTASDAHDATAPRPASHT